VSDGFSTVSALAPSGQAKRLKMWESCPCFLPFTWSEILPKVSCLLSCCWPLDVVKLEVGLDLLPGFPAISVGLEIDFFVLETAPEPLGEDVVDRPVFAIHAQLSAWLVQNRLDKSLGSKLGSLVSIDDLHRELRPNPRQSLQAKTHFKGVGQLPG